MVDDFYGVYPRLTNSCLVVLHDVGLAGLQPAIREIIAREKGPPKCCAKSTAGCSLRPRSKPGRIAPVAKLKKSELRSDVVGYTQQKSR